MISDVMEAERKELNASAQLLLTGLIDYAGLFPPAGLAMQPTVQNYARYLQSDFAWMLGRLIVPMKRLDEFEQVAHQFLPKGNPVLPWRISALSSGDLTTDLERIAEFNYWHAVDENAGAAVVDTLELKAETPEQIQEAMSLLPRSLTTYFEIPLNQHLTELVEALAFTGAMAKVRTGGVTEQAFPTTTELAKFISRCAGERVAFKATAGLHHPIRGSYRLTYEADSASATMHGFLNVFLAAAFARFGMEARKVRDLLEETSPTAFQFTEDGVAWRDNYLTLQRLDVTRQSFAIAYGSCSFEEPLDDLKKIGLL